MNRIPTPESGAEKRHEQRRDALGWRILDSLRRDSTHALRRLIRDWQFSAGAIVILALGIGANTAVFSILNNTLFQPHPFTASERLVNIYQNDVKSGEPDGVSYPAFLDLQMETAVFEGIAADNLTEGRYQIVDTQGHPSTVRVGLFQYASTNHLDVLGMHPSLGRWFNAVEERRGDPVAVLGWRAWMRDFGGDPNVLGRTVIVQGVGVQVVGVAPMALNSSQNTALAAALWMPIGRTDLQPNSRSGVQTRLLEDRKNLFLQVRARLRDGVSIQQAQAAMNVTAQRLAADNPDSDPQRGITVLATNDVHVHPREKALKPVAATALTIVGLVLAIACSNLATLLLVRSSARSTEISIRLALGATRRQLVRHLLMESFVLSLAGAGVGIAIAHWGLRYLASVDMPVIVTMQLDYRVLGFAIAVAMLAGIGFGLTPALQVTRPDLAHGLREQKGSASASLSLTRARFTVKNVLVTGQVAASFLLLVGAVLAMNILAATQMRSVGYRSEGVAFMEIDARLAGYDNLRAGTLFEDLRRRIAALPGVESASITTGLPVEGQFDKEFTLEIAPDRGKAGEALSAEGRWAGPGYFHTLGIPILFGRVFDERDSPDSPEVIVVSEAFARRFFGTPNALGKRVRFTDGDAGAVEIVGVVGNVRTVDMVVDSPKSFLYRSAAQAGVMPTTIVARASRDEAALSGLMQQEVRRRHPDFPVLNAMTIKQRQTNELGLLRFAMVSLSTLGGLGILLAGVGLYAVVAYAVTQRTNELGIRIALGARPGNLTWLVVRDVTVLVVIGIAIGSAFSWAAMIALESSIAQILGVDLLALAPVALIIVACGAAAAYMPARRAVRTDPIAAIRHL